MICSTIKQQRARGSIELKKKSQKTPPMIGTGTEGSARGGKGKEGPTGGDETRRQGLGARGGQSRLGSTLQRPPKSQRGSCVGVD